MATPDRPYTLPHRPKSDPRAVILAVVGILAALLGLPGEMAAQLTEDLTTAVNAAIAIGTAIAGIAATARAIHHRRLQRVQLQVAAPTPFMEDDKTPITEPPRGGGR